jgi:hypothetical protein
VKKALIMVLAGICLSAGGCSYTFSSIEKNDDGSYTLTEVGQEIVAPHGYVYRCQAKDDVFWCRRIGKMKYELEFQSNGIR